MTTLALMLALAATGPSFAKNDDNKCNEDGKQTTLAGKTHTCGTCSSGGAEHTKMWFIGDLTAEEAVASCECYTDRTSSQCTEKTKGIIARTQKARTAVKKDNKKASGKVNAGAR